MKRRKKSKIAVYITVTYVMAYSLFIATKVYFGERIDLRAASKSLFIPSGATMEDVADSLVSARIAVGREKFLRYAALNGFVNVKSGHYVVKRNSTYRQMISMLNQGRQTPVNLVISGNIRTKEKLAEIISGQLEADSSELVVLLNDSAFLAELGFDVSNGILLFMPDTYNVYWNRDARRLFRDMKNLYDRFWNASRTAKLEAAKLSREGAMILASLAMEETAKYGELSRIAGVFVNRLHRGMLLQSDPTVKYAVGDFSLRRVLKSHTETDSPYNTYMYKGLPPGPICIPSRRIVDAVLDYEHHDYLYFCAKSDFSGSHVFAKTLQQHNQNASAYRSELNKRKIF
ncbi:MAG: endolytic transglycosylase MltG [Prevotellaceae bacterium]|jgi:UPF0755 protein|nr:endolytic transglycosylase MltG [Prevotellaceae bacterium]